MQSVKLVCALLLGMIPAAATGAVFTVSSTAASGVGSLDAVINAANATPGTDTIEFAIAGTGVKTLVAPTAGYRQITESLIVNGYTQSGSAMNSIASDATNARIHVEIDAAAVTAPGRVFSADSGTVILRGIALKNLQAGVTGIRQLASASTLGVHGCFLGTNAAGDTDLSAGRALDLGGVAAIGSANPAERNLISGNAEGIVVQATSTGVNIQGNLLGSDASGLNLLPNERAIEITAQAIANHLVGGTGASDGNRVVGSTLSGIRLFGEGRATWQRNRIYDNGGLGIDIGGDGIDANDPGDGDTGPNGRENAPVMYSAFILGTALRVNGRLDGNFTSGTKRVEFFASLTADATGYGQGDQYLGSVSVFPGPGAAVVEFKTSITPASMPALPFVVSAIATSADGASSEFSNVTSAQDGGATRMVTSVADSGAGSLRQALIDAAANAGADTVLFNIPGSGPHVIAPLSSLPLLNGPTIIDGYSQPGALHNTAAVGFDGQVRIVIDGSSAGFVDGFATSDRAQFFGLAIGNFGGAAILANGTSGPVLRGRAQGGVIGGPFPHHRNVISGNGGGVIASGNYPTIWGNYIGTAANGSSALGNDNSGILAQGTGGRLFENTIRFNAARGIGISGAASRTSIRRNSVYANGGLGIDLGNDGVTLNDPDDADSGPNELLNFPVLTRVRSTGDAGTLVEGTLDRPAGATALSFELDLYSNTSCDASGHGEGELMFATIAIDLPSGSSEGFSAWIPGVVLPAGRAITATASSALGDDITSEFSACVLATQVGEAVFANGFE